MPTSQIVLLGAVAGLTIFLGLPLGRIRAPMPRLKVFLNALAIGIGARIRPMGRPRKMVSPATAPSRTIWLVDKGDPL